MACCIITSYHVSIEFLVDNETLPTVWAVRVRKIVLDDGTIFYNMSNVFLKALTGYTNESVMILAQTL